MTNHLNCEQRTHCEHKNLKFCSVCDATYCVDCKKEWGTGSTWYPYTTTTTTPDITFTPTYVPNTCSHA